MLINIKKNNVFYNENCVTLQVLGTRFVLVKNLEIDNIVNWNKNECNEMDC